MLKSIASVSALSLIVQLLGFVKLLVVASFYGAGFSLDVYYLALIFPTLLLGLIGGGLQSSFMPVFGELRAVGDLTSANRLQNQILLILLLALGFIALAVVYFSEFIISVSQFSGQLDPVRSVAASSALSVLIFSFVLNALLDYWGLIVNIKGRFVAAAISPAVNIVFSSSYILLVETPDINTLVWGLIYGLLSQVVVFWFFVRRGGSLFDCSFNAGGGLKCLLGGAAHLQRVFRLFLPALIGVAVTNTNFAIDQAMASGIELGSLSILNYASRFHNVVVQSGIMTVSVVLLPRFIVLVAGKEYSELFSLLRHLLFGSVLLSLLLVVTIGALGEWFLGGILGFTALDAADIEEIFIVWFCYSVGLFATAMCVFYVKLFQAWQRPGFISVVAIASLALNVLLNWLLIPYWGVAGIAIATSVVYVFALLVYVFAVWVARSRLGCVRDTVGEL